MHEREDRLLIRIGAKEILRSRFQTSEYGDDSRSMRTIFDPESSRFDSIGSRSIHDNTNPSGQLTDAIELSYL